MTRKTNFSGHFFSTSVRRAIERERYSTGVSRRMLALLARTEEDLIARIRAMDPESRTAIALDQRLDAIRQQQEEAGRLLKQSLSDELAAFGEHEADATKKALELSSAKASAQVAVEWNGVTREQVRAAAMSRPFAGVHLRFANLNDQLDEAGKRKAAMVRDTIRRGFIEGRGIDDIVRELRGTKAQSYQDGLLARSARTTEAIVRTAITHTATAAREEVYIANADQLTGVQWVSVLDARTSPTCQAYDGQVFKQGEGPRPPAHPNCRSTTIPVFIGEKPMKKTTYGDWLSQQDSATVTDILGPTRAQLYQDGGLQVDRFVNDAGTAYTLDQLKTKEAAAFKRAGLE